MGLVCTICGCSSGQLDKGFKALFEPQHTPQQYMIVAVSSEDPDVRRDAVARVARSKQFTKDWAIKGFMAIALLETDPQTRCVAVRALSWSRDPRAVETGLKILNYDKHPPAEVRPPDALCRWDTTNLLADFSGLGLVPAEQRDAVRTTLLDRLKSDPERQVREAAARGLAQYPADETIRGLIAGLRDNDFAVVHRCELSLVHLTGRTQHCDPAAWEEWAAAHQADEFAGSGEIPESMKPPYRNKLEKNMHETREFLRWLWPGSKD